MQKLSTAMHIRNSKYTELVKDITARAAQAYLINTEVNKRRDAATNSKKKKEDNRRKYEQLQYPAVTQTRESMQLARS